MQETEQCPFTSRMHPSKGTSACGWCGEPINLCRTVGQGSKYPKYCSFPITGRRCRFQNNYIQRVWSGKKRESKIKWEWNKFLLDQERQIEKELETWWAKQRKRQERAKEKSDRILINT